MLSEAVLQEAHLHQSWVVFFVPRASIDGLDVERGREPSREPNREPS